MNKIIIMIMIISTQATLLSQVKTNEEYFEDFDKTSRIAWDLFNMDKALYTSLDMLNFENKDSIAKISMYRFCIQDSSENYNVIYGYPIDSNYIQLFNYKCDTSYTFIKEQSNYNARNINILYNIVKQKEFILSKYSDKKADLSYYFRFNSDTINLYILPSWQNSQLAVYGPDYHYSFDNNGKQIDSTISEIEPLAFSIANDSKDDIYLDLRNKEFTTLSSVFFTLIYKEYFPEIYIETKNIKTYLINLSDFRWGHIYKNR
jgi:hypothetical protein